MNLESVIQSKASQKEKNKYEQRYMESRKMVVMNLLAGKEERCRHRERAVDTGWEGEGGQPESGPDIHSTVCSTESCGGCSAAQGTQLGVRDAQKTWGAGLQREGTYVYKRLIHTAAQQKLTQHWKAITL